MAGIWTSVDHHHKRAARFSFLFDLLYILIIEMMDYIVMDHYPDWWTSVVFIETNDELEPEQEILVAIELEEAGVGAAVHWAVEDPEICQKLSDLFGHPVSPRTDIPWPLGPDLTLEHMDLNTSPTFILLNSESSPLGKPENDEGKLEGTVFRVAQICRV